MNIEVITLKNLFKESKENIKTMVEIGHKTEIEIRKFEDKEESTNNLTRECLETVEA
jgi:hypothetical protein